MSRLTKHIKAFRQTELGATAVEFAILLPILMVTFGAVVEAARIYWNFQAAAVGVRDATRYVARITPVSACESKAATQGGSNKFPYNFNAYTAYAPNASNGDSKTSYGAVATALVSRNITDGGQFPSGVSVGAVTTTYGCFENATQAYRIGSVPVARVSATVNIELPFGQLFAIVGAAPATISTTITDQQRMFGV